MDKKKLLILIFVIIIFGSQTLNMTWLLMRSSIGILVTLTLLAHLAPSIFNSVVSQIPGSKDFNTSEEFKDKFKNIPNKVKDFFDKVGDDYCKKRTEEKE